MGDDTSSRKVVQDRRSFLGAVGATVGGLSITGQDLPSGLRAQTDLEPDDQFVLRQGDQCVPVTPFSGTDTIEEFYDYRIPERYASETNGGSDPGTGPYYESVGTRPLQRPDTSVVFLYDGPDGLSLVFVHGDGTARDNGGGSATVTLSNLPSDGEWAVRDDYYVDPDTGELADRNYDNWNVGGTTHTIDWTWSPNATDGGAFRGLSGAFPVSIAPAFNEAATLYDQYYEGRVEAWELLVPDGNDVRRISLDMGTDVTIETGSCDGSPTQQPITPPEVYAVDFVGCREVVVLFAKRSQGTVPVTIETSADTRTVSVSMEDLDTSGGRPVFTYDAHNHVDENARILAVKVHGGRYENTPCVEDDDERTERGEDTSETRDEDAADEEEREDHEVDDADHHGEDEDEREREDERENEREDERENEREDERENEREDHRGEHDG